MKASLLKAEVVLSPWSQREFEALEFSIRIILSSTTPWHAWMPATSSQHRLAILALGARYVNVSNNEQSTRPP